MQRDNLYTLGSTYLLLTLGAVLGAVQAAVFMIPADVMPGGMSSLGLLVYELIGVPVGVAVLLLNIPIQVVGYRMLGGWRQVAKTMYVVAAYSVIVDVLTFVEVEPLSDDRLLNALFGGALGGISSGLVFRAGGTYGGTSTLARILQNHTGIPMSSTFLYTDAVLIGAAGLVFGWESVLYSVVSLVVGGLAADYVMEGPSVIRTVIIITDCPRAIADMVIRDLHRSVTGWDAQGMYTGDTHTVLYVTISRSEAAFLRQQVLVIDPQAFMVIGQGHTAYGATFRRVKPRRGAARDPSPPGAESS
jgi:uncharacterized membrane-anchored protein YitT (DUF2179 family)